MQLSRYIASYTMAVYFDFFNDAVSSTDSSSICQVLTLENNEYYRSEKKAFVA
jgi:hypothetical protein